MFDGRIAQCDTPATLWRQPATRQVATFLGAFNLIAAIVGAGHAAARRRLVGVAAGRAARERARQTTA